MTMTTATGPVPIATVPVSRSLDVLARVVQMARWQEDYDREHARLSARERALNPDKLIERQQGIQIDELRYRLLMTLVREPIVIAREVMQEQGAAAIRRHLVEQFARLTQAQRAIWLNNLIFIMTPQIGELTAKIATLCQQSRRVPGQQRNFLLGGLSGMGKTTALDWYAWVRARTVEEERTHVPVVKVTAPVARNSPKALYHRLLLEFGSTYLVRDTEDDLRQKLVLYAHRCGTEVIIVDEIENLTQLEMKQRLVDLSNALHGIPIICASCHPQRFVEGMDGAVAGRWNDYVELQPYTGLRLREFLFFLTLLLPFTEDSPLYRPDVARVIEGATGGNVRQIMALIRDASATALDRDLPGLSPALLEETIAALRGRQITDLSPRCPLSPGASGVLDLDRA